MQMHIGPLHSARHRGVILRDRNDFSSDAQESAAGIAAIWLIFYLVIFGVVTVAGNLTAEVAPSASSIAHLP
jgi:hypothetical protein